MNAFTFVRRNLLRSKLRAGLMIASILIAFFIFGVLAGFYRAFTWRENAAAADHLVVVNKINYMLPLPIAYCNRVRAIEGVRRVTYANWFGGYYQDPRNFVVAMAVDAETYFDVYASEFELADDARRMFIGQRTAAVVGEELARRRGWKVGDHIPISSHIFSKRNGSHTWDVTIVGLYRGRTAEIRTNSMVLQYAYLDETRSSQHDTIGWMVLQTASPEVNDQVAKAIDAAFANSFAETSSETEKAFGRAFAAQLGNIALIVSLVIGAAFVTILMIVGNTMALTVRERRHELAVLKTLGFSRRRIFGLILGESVLVALLGGIPGIALAALVGIIVRSSLASILPGLAVTPAIAFLGIGLMIGFGVIAGMIPAVSAMRLRIAPALARR